MPGGVFLSISGHYAFRIHVCAHTAVHELVDAENVAPLYDAVFENNPTANYSAIKYCFIFYYCAGRKIQDFFLKIGLIVYVHLSSPMPLGLFPATGTPGCFVFGLIHAVGLPRYLWDGLLWARVMLLPLFQNTKRSWFWKRLA